MARMKLTRAQRAALDDLDLDWGDAYDLAVTPPGWVAKRLDNQHTLTAHSPDELRGLIAADSGHPRDWRAAS
jgi:hypothetical protein